MAETEMVGRVAKAMYDERLRRAPAAAAQFDLPWGALADDERRPWLFLARAAIEEMREPTEEMLFAADWMESGTREAYGNMIDAALYPPPRS